MPLKLDDLVPALYRDVAEVVSIVMSSVAAPGGLGRRGGSLEGRKCTSCILSRNSSIEKPLRFCTTIGKHHDRLPIPPNTNVLIFQLHV